MRDLARFREAVEQYRKQIGRTEEELARELYISKGELSKRLHDYHHPPSRRTWRLKPEHVFKIVETLVKWGAITAQKQAVALFTLIEYPSLQEIDWHSSPWGRLSLDTSMNVSPLHLVHQQQKEKSQTLTEIYALYLQHIIETTQWIMLPCGREIPLERLYVSLRADEMHARERQAEHALYLQEVTALLAKARSRLSDQYYEFASLRKVVAQHPKMFMLDARSWPRLFGDREQQTLTLAQVVQRHQKVVLLGDPGSGKTTLSKWLVLQFACAVQQQKERVIVPTGLVQQGAEAEEARGEETEMLDLGPARLPVLVSIAQYARVRKPKEQTDHGLTLYEYLRSGLFLDPLRLPPGLSQEMAGALISEAVRQGQTLVMLDGLDEISDPTWRRKIMEAVRRFLQEWCSLGLPSERPSRISEQPSISDHTGNCVVITSRIVGYQFDPLVDLPHYTLEAMEQEDIIAFCRAYMQHMASSSTSAEGASLWAEQLQERIFSQAHPSIRSMASNPLLLTLIAQYSWNTRTADGLRLLPTRRVALFEEVMRAFYDQREAYWDQAGITPLRLTRSFGAVAMALHESETAGFATEEEVRTSLLSVLSNQEQVEAVLSAARDVSGFLIARGEGVYGFLHRAVQEYFAAQHLANCPEHLIGQIATYALNPTWREPLVLAAGLLSRPRYGSELIATFFNALLTMPDPVSEVCPHRELLGVAACLECEQVPNGLGEQLATGLLSWYEGSLESGANHGLPHLIRQAFFLCQRLPTRARREVEKVLSTAVQAEELPQRRAAVSLIFHSVWDSPAIAEALVIAWRTYAGPSGSILVALEGVQKRQPSSFHQRFLPLRYWLSERPHLWEYAKMHAEWQCLLQILYLPPQASFDLENINRDSPLTGEIINVLEQTISNPEALAILRQRFHVLVSQPGTALARDAALALSALGEMSWLPIWREHIGVQEALACPVIAALTLFHDFGRDSIRERIHRIVDHLACNPLRDLDFHLDQALDQARSLDHDLHPYLDFDHHPNHRIFTSIVTTSQYARFYNPAYIRDLAFVWAHGLDLHGSIDMSVVLVRNGDYDKDLISNRFRARNLDFPLSQEWAHNLILCLDFDRALDPALDLSFDGAHARLAEIAQLLQVTKQRWSNKADVVQHLDAILTDLELLTQSVCKHFLIKNVWRAFVDAYLRGRGEDSQDKSTIPQITPEAFIMLIQQLMDADDEQRSNAREALATPRRASALGKALIESLVVQGYQFVQSLGERDKELARTHVIWALSQIVHDQPDWLRDWINVASQTEEDTSAVNILETIHKITPDTFETQIQMLPVTPSHVRRPLLQSLQWQVCDHQIPTQRLSSFVEQVSDWLDQETNENMYRSFLNVLSVWQDKETAQLAGIALLKQFDALGRNQEQDKTAVLKALARLTHMQPTLIESLRISLSQKKNPPRGAVLSYLSLAEALASEERPYDFDDETRRRKEQVVGDTILARMEREVSDIFACFTILIEAGSDDIPWDSYHDLLVLAARRLIERVSELHSTELLQLLLKCLRQAQVSRDWQMQRMILAIIAACAETMPTTLRQAYKGDLEPLLIKDTTDAKSSDSRRFALTALSYLRAATTEVVLALLEGGRDINDMVRASALHATERFQAIGSDSLSSFLPILMGESTSSAYILARLLGTLGTSGAGTTPHLRVWIIDAFVVALKNSKCRREITLFGRGEGRTLEDVFYDELLRVAGWTR